MRRRIPLMTMTLTLLLIGCGGTYEYDLREYQAVEQFQWNGQMRVETASGPVWFVTQIQRVTLVSEDGRELEIRHGGARPRVFLELSPTRVEEVGMTPTTRPCDHAGEIEPQ